jgi:hypothetical protein
MLYAEGSEDQTSIKTCTVKSALMVLVGNKKILLELQKKATLLHSRPEFKCIVSMP